MSNDSNIKFFMFSVSQMNMRKDVESKLGKKYEPSLVLVNGVYKQYTEIVNDPKEARYSDAVLVTSGDIRYIKYIKK